MLTWNLTVTTSATPFCMCSVTGHEPSAKGRPWRFRRLTLAGIHDLDVVDHSRVVYNAMLGSEAIATGDWNASWRMTAWEPRGKVDGQTQAGQGDMAWYNRRWTAMSKWRKPYRFGMSAAHRRKFTPQNGILSRTCQSISG